MRELVITGGGPAGMSAAIATYENGIRDILIENNTIVLFSDFENSARINKELCYNGIQVFQVIINSESLEQYFVRKVAE